MADITLDAVEAAIKQYEQNLIEESLQRDDSNSRITYKVVEFVPMYITTIVSSGTIIDRVSDSTDSAPIETVHTSMEAYIAFLQDPANG